MDASQSLIIIDGQANYGYAVISADLRVYNWTSQAWDALTPDGKLLAAWLRPLPQHTIGPASLAFEETPSMVATASPHLIAAIYTLTAAGLPSTYVGFSVLSRLDQGVTISFAR